jgi:hypothetical protein
MFCICLRTNSDLCHLHKKLIRFFNRNEKCLQRGTDWAFKRSGLRFVFSSLILLFYLRLGFSSGLFLSGFPTISLFSILLHAQYWVRSTDHEAPHYEVFSTPLLPLIQDN